MPFFEVPPRLGMGENAKQHEQVLNEAYQLLRPALTNLTILQREASCPILINSARTKIEEAGEMIEAAGVLRFNEH